MTKTEKEKIDELVKLTRLEYHSKIEIYDLFKKYIDPNALFCMNCDPSVRTMFNIFKRWWNTNKLHYTFIKPV